MIKKTSELSALSISAVKKNLEHSSAAADGVLQNHNTGTNTRHETSSLVDTKLRGRIGSRTEVMERKEFG